MHADRDRATANTAADEEGAAAVRPQPYESGWGFAGKLSVREVGYAAARHRDLSAVGVSANGEVVVPVLERDQAVRRVHEHDAQGSGVVENLAPRRAPDWIIESGNCHIVVRRRQTNRLVGEHRDPRGVQRARQYRVVGAQIVIAEDGELAEGRVDARE